MSSESAGDTMPPCDSVNDATDAARYEDMRNALQDHNNRDPSSVPPRDKAFHNALRSVLDDIDNETNPDTRHLRVTAGYQWFVKHRPRLRAQHPEWAAAMATSLSVPHHPPGQTNRSTLRASQPGQFTRAEHGLVAESSATSTSSNSQGSEDDEGQFAQRDTSSGSSGAGSSTPGLIDSWTGQQQQQQQLSCGQPGGRRGKQSQRAGSSSSPEPHSPATSRALEVERAAHHNLCGAFDRWLAISPTPDALHLDGEEASSSSSSGIDRPFSSSSSSHTAAVYLAERQKWADVHLRQAALVADVGKRMAAYASHRARAEGETLRKQEAKLLGNPSTQQQQRAPKAPAGAPGAGKLAAAGGGDAMSPAARALLRLDSQHQAPQLSAYHRPNTTAAQLVPPSPLRETKSKLQQESLQEAARVGSRLASSGVLCTGDAVSRALVPLPDQPFLHCVGSLPRPGAALVSVPGSGPGEGLAKKKKKKKAGKDAKPKKGKKKAAA